MATVDIAKTGEVRAIGSLVDATTDG
jgi:hypothetical protein